MLQNYTQNDYVCLFVVRIRIVSPAPHHTRLVEDAEPRSHRDLCLDDHYRIRLGAEDVCVAESTTGRRRGSYRITVHARGNRRLFIVRVAVVGEKVEMVGRRIASLLGFSHSSLRRNRPSFFVFRQLAALRHRMTALGTVTALDGQEGWANDTASRVLGLAEEMRGVLRLGLTCVLAKLAHLDGRNTALVGVHGSDSLLLWVLWGTGSLFN